MHEDMTYIQYDKIFEYENMAYLHFLPLYCVFIMILF